jgi:hypothetical protein
MAAINPAHIGSPLDTIAPASGFTSHFEPCCRLVRAKSDQAMSTAAHRSAPEWSPTKSDGLSDLIVSDPAPQTA